MLSAKMCTNIK